MNLYRWLCSTLILWTFWTSPLEARPLRVLTLNNDLVCVGPGCLFAESPQGKERAKQIGAWIRTQNPDIVFLQEIWQPFQYDLIKEYSGMPHGYYAKKPSETAILSKYPLENPQFLPLIWTGGSQLLHAKVIAAGYRAGITTAKVHLEGGQDVLLGNVHALPRDVSISGFDSPEDVATPDRKVGLLYMNHSLSLLAGTTPIILGGDFNMNQKSIEYGFHIKTGLWTDSYRSKRDPGSWQGDCTFCSENPFVMAQHQPGEGILDYIFSSQGCTRVQEAHILKDTDTFSDHRAVAASIEFLTDPCYAPKQGYLDQRELKALHQHIQNTSLHLFSFFGGLDIWLQRKKTLDFIQGFLPR